MPLRFEIKKKLSARSDRVKSVDIHPTEPWILSSLFNGNVYIWNYQTQALVKTFEVADQLPVRIAKFVTRKQWVLTGSDDMQLRVYNYNTMEKLKAFEAHSDYIRSLAIHPTQPYVLSSSDDMTIKLWDWDKNWANVQIFEGHTHYVMQLVFNPKDTNTFASASLDRTIKVWSLGSTTPNFTLEGHEKGVNCVDYYMGGEKPYLISGADDKLVKIWDYQNKTCVQTLEGHTHNVTVTSFHPEVPVIITGSEDGTVRVWHLNTYRLEKTLNYGLERVWAIGHLKGSNYLALGYDEGTVMLKLGKEEPAVSMDNNGKVIWAKHNEIQTATIRPASETEVADGERITLSAKELGSCEVYPQTLQHTPNGRFVVVCGDGEYIIYTALAWRNKAFGQGLEFVWGTDTGEYAVRESTSKVKLYKNFKETKTLRPNFSAEGIFGGPLLGVRSRDFIALYDWDECRLIRRIDVCPKQIYWSDNNEMVAICCESAFYILKYSKEQVAQHLATVGDTGEEGIESAFEVLHEISERVRTAIWVGDCFLYTNNNNRLNYCVGSEIVTISHLDRTMYLLGYIPRDNRLYLTDKSLNLVSYQLQLTVINYQTAVLRGDLDAASQILPEVPTEQRTRIAHFLEAQGYKEQALQVSLDPDHKFELAVQLEKLELATEIARENPAESKWKQLSDLALGAGKFDLAEQSFKEADDLGGLLLLYTSTCDSAGLESLAQLALQVGRHNIAFVCFFMLKKLPACLDLLVETGRIPEAAFLARTYVPSQVPRIVRLWKEDLKTINERAAESLADPIEFPNLFPDLKTALQVEKFLEKSAGTQPASAYLKAREEFGRDLISEVRAMNLPEISFEISAAPTASAPAASDNNNAAPASPVVAKAAPAPTVPMSPPTPAKQTAPAPATPTATQTPVTPAATQATPTPTPAAPASPVAPRTSSPAPAPITPVAAPVQTPVSPTLSPTVPKASAVPTPAPTPAKASAIEIPLLDDDEDFDDALARELESELDNE